MTRTLKIVGMVLVCCSLAVLISFAAWKISTTPACNPGYQLHTKQEYTYGYNVNGKWGYAWRTTSSCVRMPQ